MVAAEQLETTRIRHVSPDTPLEEILEIYERDRFLVIDDLTDGPTMDALWSEVEAQIAVDPLRRDRFLGLKTRRTSGFVDRIPACRPMLAHPLIVALMERVTSCRSDDPERDMGVQLNATFAIGIEPGETRQAMHRDRGPWSGLPLPMDYDFCVNCMWAATDFTAENGATHVVPGSFLLPDPVRIADIVKGEGATLPDGRLVNKMKTLRAEMTQGSVFVWSGNVYHGGGANESDSLRAGMSVTYVPAALRQEENQFLIAPPEKARHYPQELQELLGYRKENYALGVIENMEDPQTLLR